MKFKNPKILAIIGYFLGCQVDNSFFGDSQISVLEDEAESVQKEIKRGEVCDFLGPLEAPSFGGP